MKVAVFVEDAAHASFVVRLVQRLADDQQVDIKVDVRNALGGRGSVMTSLKRFVRDVALGKTSFAELLVVAIDGNCQGSQRVRKAITEIVKGQAYAGTLACAVPNPHIELWYLADGAAVLRVIGSDGAQPPLPQHKCERSRYKTLLRDTFVIGDINPPGGGSEYGDEVAAAMDLPLACSNDEDLARFVDEVRSSLRQLDA